MSRSGVHVDAPAEVSTRMSERPSNGVRADSKIIFPLYVVSFVSAPCAPRCKKERGQMAVAFELQAHTMRTHHHLNLHPKSAGPIGRVGGGVGDGIQVYRYLFPAP